MRSTTWRRKKRAQTTEITAADLQDLLESDDPPQLVDVRNQWEHDLCRIEGSILLPLNVLPQRLDTIDRRRPVVVYCHHGIRSLMAAQILQQAGFTAQSLHGGIDLWSQIIDPAVPRY